MENKSELIKTFLMSTEFSGREDIEINVTKSSAGFYHIVIYTYLGPDDGIISRIEKRLNLGDIKNLIHNYNICDKFFLQIEQGWKDCYLTYKLEQ